MSDFTIINGNCLDEMRKLPANSVDAIVCDPPYGIEFMGNKWDYEVPSVDVWRECLRVLKPGGHLLAFAGTRTQHRMAVNIEDAGFDIRDMIAWVYGSGFPKSLDVSKAFDKAAGAEREVVGKNPNDRECRNNGMADYGLQGGVGGSNLTVPATDAAKQWAGWGTALKPAMEPITVARKPLIGTVAENVQKYGTGAINVDGCRVGTEDRFGGGARGASGFASGYESGDGWQPGSPAGRWPANLIHDGSDEVEGLFPQSKDGWAGGTDKVGCFQQGVKRTFPHLGYGGAGSAARFFYCAKANKRDRDEGCEGLEERGSIEFSQGKAGRCPEHGESNKSGENTYACGCKIVYTGEKARIYRRNHHPTVKPTDLMRYLCRLVCPPGGVVLDPFMGSGSTGKGALLEDCKFIGIDLNADYCKIADKRLTYVVKSKPVSLEGLFG